MKIVMPDNQNDKMIMMIMMETLGCTQLKRPTVPSDAPGSSQSLSQPELGDMKETVSR